MFIGTTGESRSSTPSAARSARCWVISGTVPTHAAVHGADPHPAGGPAAVPVQLGGHVLTAYGPGVHDVHGGTDGLGELGQLAQHPLRVGDDLHLDLGAGRGPGAQERSGEGLEGGVRAARRGEALLEPVTLPAEQPQQGDIGVDDGPVAGAVLGGES